MLRSDFLTILGYLRSIYNGKITLMTNGTLITPKNVKEIVSQIDSIDISISLPTAHSPLIYLLPSFPEYLSAD